MAYTNTIKSIAIGSFDGIHIAHRVLIEQVDALVIIERNGGYLTPGYKRSEFTDKLCYFYNFDGIKELTPEGFVSRLKEDFPLLERIVVGYDFHFGKNKAGNVEILKMLFDKEIVVVEEVSIENIPVHSRTIKTYLKKGNMQIANLLLGRVYHIEGEVIRGQGLGKKALVPTLNLEVKDYQMPQEGVYVTRTKIEEKWHNSVSFLGYRMSTDGSFAVESHILDEEIAEVNGIIKLEFVAQLRRNQKFDTLELLKKQIEDDISKAKEHLK